jgi:Holliday junction DNA helicase RuvA
MEVDVNGVWYEVHLPACVWRAFDETDVGEVIDLEIFYHASERNPTPKLVGFKREIERAFFQKFILVPDMGPTKALKALSFSVSAIARWIENSDVASLSRLQGVGPRMADKIVAELKGKVIEEALLQDEGFDSEPEREPEPTLEEVKQDAVAALVNLQFGRGEALRVVDEIVRDEAVRTVEEIITGVFQRINRPQ